MHPSLVTSILIVLLGLGLTSFDARWAFPESLPFTPASLVFLFGSVASAVSSVLRPPFFFSEGTGIDTGPTGFRGRGGIMLAAILLAGTLLRVSDMHRYPLNGDEHLFVNTAHAESLSGVWAGIQYHLHPPANFYMLHFLQKVSVNPLLLRFPALLAGIYLIWISFQFVRSFCGDREGYLVALFVAFSPALVDLSRVCRNYTPGYAFMLTGLYFCFRYQRTLKKQDIIAFAIFETFAIAWLYSTIIPLAAANIVLLGSLLLKPETRRKALDAFVLQVPVAIIVIFLYLAHIRIVGGSEMSGTAASFHEDEIFQNPMDYLQYFPLPLLMNFRYLLAGLAGLIGALLGIGGAVYLWRRDRRSLVLTSALVFGMAYLFRFAVILPFSGNRQSSFTFPFVFVMAAAGLSFLLEGMGKARGYRFGSDAAPSDSAMSRSSGMRGRLPVIAVSLFLLLFANLALGMQEGTVFFDRQDELPNTYEDLERTVSLLRQHAGPDDLLLVSYQGLSAYQAYLRKEAIPYEPARVTTIEEEGLRFVYSPESGWFFTPESVVRSYFDARKALRLDRVERVWVVRGTGWPWEKPIRDWFHHDYPDVRLDDALVVESRGWLMPARAGDLDSHATEVASIEKFYTEDFIRSQIPPEQRKTPDYFIAP